MPNGDANCAVANGPFIDVATPLPAKVETSPAGVILRIRLLRQSVTKRLPEGSKAIPTKLLKMAAEPFPSAKPVPLMPAKVDTVTLGPVTTTGGITGSIITGFGFTGLSFLQETTVNKILTRIRFSFFMGSK